MADPTRDPTPEDWAERHDGLISREVASDAGLGRGAINRRRANGRYRSIRPGILAISGAPRTWMQLVRATLLSLPVDDAASHATSMRLWGCPEVAESDGIDVSGPSKRRTRLSGVRGHRIGTAEPGDIVRRHGIRCTSPLRTVIDVSGSLDAVRLGRVVDYFLRLRVLRLEELRSRVNRTRPAPGRSVRVLRKVLADRIPGYDPGESELEGRIARVLDRAHLPRPTQQHRLQFGARRYRIDFAWPDRKLYLEGNGFGCHSLMSDLDRDARRQNELVLDGWTPIEVTWRMSDPEIEAVLRCFLHAFGQSSTTVVRD